MNTNEIQSLPPIQYLSQSTLSHLQHRFSKEDDLSKASVLVIELKQKRNELNKWVSDLSERLERSLVQYASCSNQVGGLFNDINLRLTDLTSSSCSLSNSYSSSDGRDGESILVEELPALAKEVARVETVRIYAETALKLDALVGDIEDAVSASMKRNLSHPLVKKAEELCVQAVNSLKVTEDVLTKTAKTWPQWTHLVSAVDHRVDRALAILRPQAIADHRALLSSLGWPPPLSALSSSSLDTGKATDVSNPLLTMQGDLKHHYCENFLALCRLQELQRQRKSRQLEGFHREVALHQPLWAIEELVSPISVASQCHFSKWVDKPEFIFALVYKTTRDYVDSIDELLQPLVDEARLIGYSCREEWISAMVTSLSTYLAKEVFPIYVSQLEEESVAGVPSQARISWLHLVDLMISFDKRVQSLVEHSGIMISLEEDQSLQKISSLSVFSDRPDWLNLWTNIELRDMLDKLKPDIEDERSWTMKVQAAVLSGPEDLKSPLLSSAFLRQLSSVVERSRSLPSIPMRSKFLRLTGGPIVQEFLDCILVKCQEAEGLTALADDDALIKVTRSINAAHYFEGILKEWCQDVFFLEMELQPCDQSGLHLSYRSPNGITEEEHEGGVFDKEIGKLVDFRTEWVNKLSTVVLRGFEAQCRDHIKNRKQWQEKGTEGLTVSNTFVGALDYLQEKASILEGQLNRIDFVSIWRSLASGVDRIIFNGIFMSSAKFSNGGVKRLHNDFEVLFGVFGAWCLRPEGFFPKATEGLKLLEVGEEQVQEVLSGGETWLKDNGIRHLNAAEAEKIANSKLFSS
ncbi:RINT-1/Tip20 [Dillenia turbinata]|uniref:RINT-1/Tip20 n=1 Tax=Dillenia turbinata TaxID=194707 RepID=A0AAN8UZV8_9MAGN